MDFVIIALSVILGIAVLSALLWLYMIFPGGKRQKMQRFVGVHYAHRGLHDESKAENSMSAFRAAKENGYGIELDVRLSKDGELVVFHDATLKRVCGLDQRVVDLTLSELKKIKLGTTEDTVPTLKEVLELVDGRVPLLVEIKQDMGEGDVATSACRMLKEYEGDYMIESFNPLAIRTVKKELPHIVRGILSDNYTRDKAMRKPLYRLLKNLLFNFLCRPDFVAFNHREFAHSFTVRLVKKLYHPPLFAWTVRSEEEEKRCYDNGFDGVIFENYLMYNNSGYHIFRI